MLALIVTAYFAGAAIAAFLCGFLRVRLDGMPVGVFALMWPIVLPFFLVDAACTGLARFGVHLSGEDRK